MAQINQAPVIVFGEVLFDCFEQDGSRVLGGAPFNVAWHLQGFGVNPLFISRLGDDEQGKEIRTAMQGWGMSLHGLQTDSHYPTGRVSITLENGQPKYEILSEQAYDYIAEELISDIGEQSIVYHGSLGLRAPDSMRALQSILSIQDCRVFLDVNLRVPWWKKNQVLSLLKHTTWLKINDEELQLLVDGDDDLPSKALRLMDDYQLSSVIYTEGSKGASYIDRQTRVSVSPEIALEVVDTVGAGDAFASVCLLGLIQGWPMDRVLDRAQAFASLVVQQRGATLKEAETYSRLLSDWVK